MRIVQGVAFAVIDLFDRAVAAREIAGEAVVIAYEESETLQRELEFIAALLARISEKRTGGGEHRHIRGAAGQAVALDLQHCAPVLGVQFRLAKELRDEALGWPLTVSGARRQG